MNSRNDHAFADAAMQRFQAALLLMAPVPLGEWQWLSSQVSTTSLVNGSYLYEAGEMPQALYYLHQGIARFYYITEDGKEFNKAFGRAGELVGSLMAQVSGEVCTYYVQALTPMQVLKIPLRALVALYDRHPCWDRIGRKLAEQAAVRKEVREREFLLADSLGRYHSFCRRYPDLLGVIAQKHIASYIGITEVALSRLLNKG